MKYHTLRRAGRVKRYHTVPVIHTQNVAEHSFGVLLILLHVTDGAVSNELVKAAMFHDLAELHTGDIPAPTKWKAPILAQQLELLETSFDNANGTTVFLSEEEKNLLKFADMMDLCQYAIDELNTGNTNAKEILVNGNNFLQNFALGKNLPTQALTMIGNINQFVLRSE